MRFAKRLGRRGGMGAAKRGRLNRSCPSLLPSDRHQAPPFRKPLCKTPLQAGFHIRCAQHIVQLASFSSTCPTESHEAASRSIFRSIRAGAGGEVRPGGIGAMTHARTARKKMGRASATHAEELRRPACFRRSGRSLCGDASPHRPPRGLRSSCPNWPAPAPPVEGSSRLRHRPGYNRRSQARPRSRWWPRRRGRSV